MLDDIDHLLDDAIALHEAKRFFSASAKYLKILEQDALHADTNHNFGLLKVELGLKEEALILLQTAINTNPNVLQYWVTFINTLTIIERFDDARAVLEQAHLFGHKDETLNHLEHNLDLAQKNYEALTKPDELNLSKSVNAETNSRNSVKVEQKTSISSQENSNTQYSDTHQTNILDSMQLDQAIKLAKKKTNEGLSEEAKKIYQDILAKFPKNKKALDGLKGHSGKAPSSSKISQDPAENQIQHLKKLYDQGKLGEVFEQTSTLTKQYPNNWVLWNLLGISAAQLGKLDKAIDAFKKVICVAPDYADAYNNMGNVLKNQGKLEEAIESYNKAISIKPDYAEAWNNIYFPLQAIKIKTTPNENINLSYPKDINSNYGNIQLDLLDYKLHRGQKSEGSYLDRAIESLSTADNLTIQNQEFDKSTKGKKQPLPDKVVALVHFGRSGTGLLQSLIDGHPEVSTLPSIYFSQYFDHSIWTNIISGGWHGMVDRFIEIYEVLFDASSYVPVETKSKKLEHKIGIKYGMANVGDQKNEVLTVNKDLFKTELKRLMACYEELDASIFFRLVHAAYDKALNDLNSKRLIFYHIHNPDTCAQLNFQRSSPTAEWVMMVREPVQSLESWVGGSFQKEDYTGVVNRISTMLFEIDNSVYSRQKTIGVRLEDLKKKPEETIPALCKWMGITEEDSLYQMTVQGKKWWGDPGSPDYSKDGMDPFGKTSINRKIGSIFSENDQFVLRTLFYPFSVRFGYTEENEKQFKADLKKIRPMIDELFDFEKVLAELLELSLEKFKRFGSYVYLRSVLIERWETLNKFKTYPNMIRPLKFPKNKKALDELQGQSGKAQSSSKIYQSPTENQIQHLIKLYNQGELVEVFEQTSTLTKQYPNSFMLWNLLGTAAAQISKLGIAMDAFETAISIKPDYALAYYNMGNVLKEQGKPDKAVEAYKKAISIEPENVEAYYNMGNVLKEQGKLEETEEAYTKVLSIKPDHESAKHMLSALTGKTLKTAPRKYVENLFDQFASNFEALLVTELEYETPKLIRDVLIKSSSHKSLGSILDLGCGTGLFGLEIKDYCSKLEGIDLSNNMLSVANQKNVYDTLSQSDIVEYLSSTPLDFDYYIALDVFIYVGDLSEIFRLIKSRSRKSGKLVFSTEHSEVDGYHILKTGRYSHSKSYIESLCEKFGYKISHFSTNDLRKEKGEFLAGGIYILEFENKIEHQTNILDTMKLGQAIKLARKKTNEGLRQEAKKIYQDILVKFPKNKKALDGLKGHSEKAPSSSKISKDPAENQIQRLIKLCNQGKLGEVFEQTSTLTKQYPNSLVLWNLLGASAAQTGKLDEAIDAFKKAISIKPDYADAYNNLGNALKGQGKLEEAIEAYNKVLSIKPDTDAYYNMGNTLKEQGKLEEAVEAYNKAISIKPDNSRAYNNMGTTFKEQEKLEEAMKAYNKAISIRPDYAEAYYNMGTALQNQGKLEEAIEAYNKVLSIQPDYADAYHSMGIALQGMKFNKPSREIQKKIVSLLDRKTYVRPKDIVSAAISLLKFEPSLQKCLQMADNEVIENPSDVISDLSNLPLLLKLMSVCPLPDLGLEKLLRKLRASLLLSISDVTISPELLNFQSALALQCFTNEYIYSHTAEEEKILQSLEANLRKIFKNNEQPAPQIILALASYKSLNQYEWSKSLLVYDKIEAVFTRQVVEPNQEAKLKSALPILDNITDEVSSKVRDQYEGSPYPRWVNTGLSSEPMSISNVVSGIKLKLHNYKITEVEKPEILVAGCGTGQHSIRNATRFKGSNVLAIDLSLSSLGYAKRKTEEIGVGNIKYMQADILDLSKLGKKFDIVESVGVLHHMDNPAAGWKVLTDCLKPGGLMKIGLYSDLARQHIVKIRKEISNTGIGSSDEEMKSFRDTIIGSEKDHHEEILNFIDFYSLSELKDLLFHVQEHRFTIPQVRDCLSKFGLEFCGFETNEEILSHFHKSNAGVGNPYNLEKWQAYEEANPKTFGGMYQFWCQKVD